MVISRLFERKKENKILTFEKVIKVYASDMFTLSAVDLETGRVNLKKILDILELSVWCLFIFLCRFQS